MLTQAHYSKYAVQGSSRQTAVNCRESVEPSMPEANCGKRGREGTPQVAHTKLNVPKIQIKREKTKLAKKNMPTYCPPGRARIPKVSIRIVQ